MVSLKSHAPRLFIVTGMVLALLPFTLGYYGFPFLQFSNWNDEVIALCMFAFGALIALWMISGALAGWLEINIPRNNLLLNCWLAWLGWQIFVTLLAPLPWRSWFGPPEQSEGVAWYICASLLMLQFSAFWHNIRFRKWVLGLSFALMFILALLHFVSDERNNIVAGFIFPLLPDRYFIKFIPYVWPDYLGFMAGWWLLALMLSFPGLAWRYTAALGVGVLFILLASSNHGAFAVISYGMLITLVARLAQSHGLIHFREGSAVWRKLATIVLLLPVVWLIASPYITMNYQKGQSQSLPARILYNHIAMNALAHEPSRLLLGKGWGQSEDDFYKYALVGDLRIYDDGKHNPNWELLRGYNYHSHNMAAETLLSLGALGFLLWLIMPILVLRRIDARDFWSVAPILIAVTLLSHLWFALPQAMPYQALCWFLLISRYSATSAAFSPKAVKGAIALAVAAMLWTAFQQFEAIRYSLRITDPYGKFSGHVLTAEDMQQDIKRGGDRLRVYFISTTKRITQAQGKLEPKHLDLYRKYIESAEKLSEDPRAGAYSGMAILYGYNVLLTVIKDPLLEELEKRARTNYFAMTKLHTKRAPLREDAIAPFMKSIYESNHVKKPEKVMGVVQELLAIDPSHRSALWIGGKTLSAQTGFEEQGRDMMRAALALGADKVYMIPTKEIEASRAQKPLKNQP